MKYIIDRLEEGLAICETELRKCISVPVSHLPKEVKEGDVLREAGFSWIPKKQIKDGVK